MTLPAGEVKRDEEANHGSGERTPEQKLPLKDLQASLEHYTPLSPVSLSQDSIVDLEFHRVNKYNKDRTLCVLRPSKSWIYQQKSLKKKEQMEEIQVNSKQPAREARESKDHASRHGLVDLGGKRGSQSILIQEHATIEQ